MKKKTLTIAIALVLVVALAVGATYALLTAKTDAVNNTFIAGKLTNDKDALTLKEHDVKQNADGSYVLDKTADAKEGNKVEYGAIVPGTTIEKDPTVTVKGLTGAAYLYIVVDDTVDKAELNHTVDSANWTVLKTDDTKTLYVYAVNGGIVDENTTSPLSLNVLTNNQLTAADKLTQGKDMGHIIVNAYLVQAAGSASAAAAWDANGGFGTGITATVAP